MSFKITMKTHVECLFIAYLFSFLLNDQINMMIEGWILSQIYLYPTSSIVINFIIYLAILLIPISIAHELLHGAAYKLFNCTVSYGFKGFYAYTKETSGRALERNSFIFILLAPVVSISAACLIYSNHITMTIFVLNFLGSTGDILMTLVLLKYDRSKKIIDRDYGFDIY